MCKKYDVGYLIIALGILVFMIGNCIFQINTEKDLKEVNNKINELASETDASKEDYETRFDNIEKIIIDDNEKINNLEKNIEDLTFTIDDIVAEREEKEAEEVVKVTQSVKPVQSTQYTEPSYTSTSSYEVPTDGLTASGGVNYYGDQKETYYNLNMSRVVDNAQNTGLEGEYWVREDGVKMFGDKVIVAANQDVYPYGTTVDTSLGEGIVLDTGTFANSNPTQVDIATDW